MPMRDAIDSTIIALDEIYNSQAGQRFLKNLIDKCKTNLEGCSSSGLNEVKKFNSLVEAFKSTDLHQFGDTTISLKGYTKSIHGTGLFTVFHGYVEGLYCEVGDLMWISLIHNYDKKVTFSRVNFMQNKDRANDRTIRRANLKWKLELPQLHALTSYNKMVIKTNNIKDILSTYFDINYHSEDHKDQTCFSRYIASYGLFTNDDMITLAAHTVTTLANIKKITKESIDGFYHGFNTLFCNADRNYPYFYKKILRSYGDCYYPRDLFQENSMSELAFHEVYRFLTREFIGRGHYFSDSQQESRYFHFLDYAKGIDDFITMFMYFNVGELFYQKWDGDTPPKSPFSDHSTRMGGAGFSSSSHTEELYRRNPYISRQYMNKPSDGGGQSKTGNKQGESTFENGPAIIVSEITIWETSMEKSHENNK